MKTLGIDVDLVLTNGAVTFSLESKDILHKKKCFILPSHNSDF